MKKGRSNKAREKKSLFSRRSKSSKNTCLAQIFKQQSVNWEEIERQRQEEEERKRQEKQAKRRKRLKIGIAVVAVLIVLSMFTGGDDDSKLSMPVASQEYVGEDYQAVASGLEELGFSNIVVEPIKATASESQKQGAIKEISIDGSTSFNEGSQFDPESKIIIRYYEISEAVVAEDPETESETEPETEPEEKKAISAEESIEPETETETEATKAVLAKTPSETAVVTGISLADIPEYSGSPYVAVNGNVPFFTDEEMSTTSYGYYSSLDSLGRCGVCVASVGQDIMPTEERGSIGSVRPSGWHTIKYSGIVDGNYLYNRCHLIGYQLTGENANTKNLITGTRYLNIEGMLPFENMVADYVKETGNHVMYRVSPMFDGNNLVASGVLMEAKSVEDNGAGILYNVYCYNVQPGIAIDYASGDSVSDGTVVADSSSSGSGKGSSAKQETVTQQESTPAETTPAETTPAQNTASGSYAVNANNGKIHIVGKCAATKGGSNAMKNPVYFNTYEEAEAYSVNIKPGQSSRQCGNCW